MKRMFSIMTFRNRGSKLEVVILSVAFSLLLLLTLLILYSLIGYSI